MTITLKQGIIDTAKALGMDPTVLATIISYETGGTFEAAKIGPRTQYGQHRGLIQFGEPQAKQYGVDWANALESQLGNNGDNAISRYFKASGYKPGMGLLDAYSIVNAGKPGDYRAMDAGTSVSQKVYSDVMRKHGEKAAGLLGGEFTPAFDTSSTTPSANEPNPYALSLTPRERPEVQQPRDTLIGDIGKTLAGGVAPMNSSGSSLYGGPETGDGSPSPPLEFASAAAAPALTGPPPSPEMDFSPLAQLFSIKNIGQAPAMQAANPIRRTYG